MSNEDLALHLKYRPKDFSTLVGHEDVVTRLKGILKTGKIPNAFLITGSTSAGKTTLARCLASEINGTDMTNHPDFTEVDTGSKKTIDDIRELIKLSKFRPQTKRKFILLDEAQQLLTNGQAAAAMLKNLEEPSKQTVWILCSMDPAKFQTDKNGKAIMGRCSQIHLQAHSDKELFKQALRICKAEKMGYMLDEEKSALKYLVKNCNGEMRTLSTLIENCQQYANGLDKVPKEFTKDMVSSVMKTNSSSDEALVVELLTAVYACQFKITQKCILNIQDSFQFITLLLRLNNYYLNSTVLDGQRHPKVWPSNMSKAFMENTKDMKITLGMIAYVNSVLVEVKAQSLQFAMDADHLLSAKLYHAIIGIKAMKPKE